jgi:hypothetical protein
MGLAGEVHVWDDFHDRYLVTNLIGLSLPNGFDTSSAAGSTTTWTRLSEADRADVEREFDPGVGRHKVAWPAFEIGAEK